MTRLKPARDVRFAGTDDGAMLLDLSTGKFFGLNPTAALIWRRMAEGEAPEEIATGLSGELGVASEPAALAHLVDASMVEAHLEDEPRYRMLDTLRSFGLDRLAAEL
jgi:hypothetical protein